MLCFEMHKYIQKGVEYIGLKTTFFIWDMPVNNSVMYVVF